MEGRVPQQVDQQYDQQRILMRLLTCEAQIQFTHSSFENTYYLLKINWIKYYNKLLKITYYLLKNNTLKSDYFAWS